MATAPELIATTANNDGDITNGPEVVTGEVLTPDAANTEQTTAAAVPAVDPSLDSGRSLEELETVIERSIAGQIQAGIALLEIQARGMYKDKGFDSFTGYLQGRWGYLSAGYKLMDAAKVQLALTDGGRNENATLPKNEAQAREIAPLVRKNPEAARQVWDELTNAHDAGQLTAQDIRHVVQAKLDELRTSPAKISHAGPRPDADTDQMGNRDKTKRFASFYGDDTLIGAHIAPNSADVIVMPVTNRRNLEARISDLAETAVSRLRKGGSLLLIANPSLLPTIFAGVSDLLNYKWTLIESLDIAVQDRDDKPTVVNGYRALVWYTKGKYNNAEPISDIVDEAGLKVVLELLTPEDGIIGATGFDNEDIGDVLYLLNAKRRVTLVSANKTFLAAMDHNARAQNYLPQDAPSAADVPETGEADDAETEEEESEEAE